MSPYWDCHFFSFFLLFFKRLPALILGQAPASDEIQLIVLSLVGLSCGILSPFIVLKRMTMLVNSLSHTVLLGIVLSALAIHALWGGQLFDLSSLLLGALLAALLTALCTGILTKIFRLQVDASIGLVFSGLFALAIVLVSVYLRDVHLGVESIMGNVDALSLSDAKLPAYFTILNAIVIILFFRQFQLISFDKNLAKIFGIKLGFFQYLFLILIAATCVGAFRAVGVVVVLSLLTGPYLIARLFCSRLNLLLFLTPLIAVASCWISVALSRHLLNMQGFPLSTGGILSVVIGLIYLFSTLAVYFKNSLITSHGE